MVARTLLVFVALVFSSCSSNEVQESAADGSEPNRTTNGAVVSEVELRIFPQLARYGPGDRVGLVLVVGSSLNLQTQVTKGIDSYLERLDLDGWTRLYVLTGEFEDREASSWPIHEQNRVIPDLAWTGEAEEFVVLPEVEPGRYRIVKDVRLSQDGIEESVMLSAELEIR